jgi:transcriptional regulator
VSRYAPRKPDDVVRFIADQVLGTITTHDASGYIATPLPLLAELTTDGEIEAIVGHFARSNPHVARVRANPVALVTFLGSHGYIAPSIVSRVGWAPTWNYQFVQLEVQVELDPALNDQAIAALVRHMEGADDQAWSTAQVGARYAQLAAHVVAFRARVRSTAARFKLGQDEDRQSFDEIVTALGPTKLASAMRAQRTE